MEKLSTNRIGLFIMVKKTVLTFSLFILFILSACTAENTSQSILQDIDNPEIEAVKELLIDNLKYAENKNIEGYLSTIPVDSHAETREVMEEFFNTYTVKHTLLEFEVVEVLEDEIVAKARQKTEEVVDSDESEYKSHIAETLHVFQRIESEWKITDSSVTDITFIE